MSPFLADSSVPRATTVTRRISLRTFQVLPVYACRANRAPDHQARRTTKPNAATAPPAPTRILRRRLQRWGRGGREEACGWRPFRSRSPFTDRGGVAEECASDSAAGGVWGGC